MLFEIKNCKIREVTDNASGTSQSGKDWRKATVILEQEDGNYTETYAVQAFDDKIDVVSQYVGQKVDIKFTIKAREYNGRWYNDLRFQYVSTVEQAKPAPAPAPITPKDEEINKKGLVDDPNGDLPF